MNPLDGQVPDNLRADLQKAPGYTADHFLGDCVDWANTYLDGWKCEWTPHVQNAWRDGCCSPVMALAYARFKVAMADINRRLEIKALEQQWSGPPVRIGQGEYERLEGDTNPGAPVAYVLGIVVIVAVTCLVCWIL